MKKMKCVKICVVYYDIMNICDGIKCGKGRKIPNSPKYICEHNNLKVLYPHLINEWHSDNESMENYLPKSGKKVKWICKKNLCGCHIWETYIHSRTARVFGCPYCINQKLCSHNNLAAIYPELISEWHPDNGDMKKFSPGSNFNVKWICQENSCGCHIWKTAIFERTGKRHTGCPYCSHKKLCVHNNLAATYPKLIPEWHPDNDFMENYSPNSNFVVKWNCSISKCKCHIWYAAISKRTNSLHPTGCPYCTNQKLCAHNNLEFLYPNLKKEWHPNNPKMTTFPPCSSKKVSWICSTNKNHVWSGTISNRTGKIQSGCPQCTNHYSKNQLKWLDIFATTFNINIQTIKHSEGEYKVKGPNNRPYLLDGYTWMYEGKIAFEYNGCYYHGCRKCFDENHINKVVGKTCGELRKKTKKRKKYLESIGFYVITMKECEFDPNMTEKDVLNLYEEVIFSQKFKDKVGEFSYYLKLYY